MKLESNRIYNNLVRAWTAKNHLKNALSNNPGARLTRKQAIAYDMPQQVYKNYLNALNKERKLGFYSNKNKINNAAKKVNSYIEGKKNALNQLNRNYPKKGREYNRKKNQLNRNYKELNQRSTNNLNRLLRARNLRKRILNKKPTPNQARRTIYKRVFARHINKLLYHPNSGTRSSAMLNAYEPITRVRAAKLIREAERRGFKRGRGSR